MRGKCSQLATRAVAGEDLGTTDPSPTCECKKLRDSARFEVDCLSSQYAYSPGISVCAARLFMISHPGNFHYYMGCIIHTPILSRPYSDFVGVGRLKVSFLGLRGLSIQYHPPLSSYRHPKKPSRPQSQRNARSNHRPHAPLYFMSATPRF